jgi:hypothetical protein
MSASREPQQIMGGKAWYYEYPGSIEIIVPNDPALGMGSGGIRRVQISRRLLEKSLRRMRTKRPRRVAPERAPKRRKATN